MPDLGLEDHDDFDFCIIIKVCLSCDFGEASRCLWAYWSGMQGNSIASWLCISRLLKYQKLSDSGIMGLQRIQSLKPPNSRYFVCHSVKSWSFVDCVNWRRWDRAKCGPLARPHVSIKMLSRVFVSTGSSLCENIKIALELAQWTSMTFWPTLITTSFPRRRRTCKSWPEHGLQSASLLSFNLTQSRSWRG